MTARQYHFATAGASPAEKIIFHPCIVRKTLASEAVLTRLPEDETGGISLTSSAEQWYGCRTRQNGGSFDDIPTHRPVRGSRGYVSHPDCSSCARPESAESGRAGPIHCRACAGQRHRPKRRL